MPKRVKSTNEQIIAALLQCGTVRGAANLLNVGERMIYDRKKDPDFIAMYNAAKNDILKAATARLQGSFIEAADTMADIMKDENTPKQTRLNAAVEIIRNGLKLTDTAEVMERITALEAAQNGAMPQLIQLAPAQENAAERLIGG